MRQGYTGFWRFPTPSRCQTGGELSDVTFNLDGDDHTIFALYYRWDEREVFPPVWLDFYFLDEIRVAWNLDARYFSVYADGTVASRAVCSPRYWFGSDFSDQLCWPTTHIDLADWTAGSTVEVKVTEIVRAPPSPTSLTATANGPTRIDLAWAAPRGYNGPAITGYRIEVSVDGGMTFELLASTGPSTTSYSHSMLPPESTRHYRVSTINRSVDEHGLTPASATADATTDSGPNVPPARQQHTLPLVLADGMANRGFIRVINRSDAAGTVTVHAIDDTGERFGPVSFDLAANATKHFNSGDLEQGNAGKGLSAGLGDGAGDWRLELTTELDIEPLAYIRAPDGFLTSVHDVVQPEYIHRDPRYEIDEIRYVVRFFNPGSNRNQVSRLRVINRAGVDTPVIISAVDDRGESAPGGEVRLTLGPYEARTFSVQQLEEGDDDLEGMLGSGRGKWQLIVAAERLPPEQRRYSHPIQVMSLLLSRASGNLTNVSSIGEGNDANRGGPDTDWLWGGVGDDVLNPGDNPTTYDSVYGSPGNDTIVYTDSSPAAFQWLGYLGIDTGIRATIDGTTNEGTVDKGSNGTDTIVDIANPLDAAVEAPFGGFGLGGSPLDDEFDLTLADGQWMTVRGEEGNDTIRIHSGRVVINYWNTANGVEVDLEAGRANDDGHGTVDTFIGDVYRVEGGLGDDTLLGRNNGGDRLDGGPGDDTINPRDSDWEVASDNITGSPGNDQIILSDSTGPRASVTIEYDRLGNGGVTATIDGPNNRATVDKGPGGVDTIVDIENLLDHGGFTLKGSRLDDVIKITVGDGHWMQVSGDAGNDTFDFRYEEGGWLRLNYASPRGPNGIDVDLEAGRANDDGFGDVDTFVNEVREIRGTDLDDVIRGSGNDETFIGRRGNDTIDGRGGYDRLRFDRSGIGNVSVDLEEGTAEGTWGDGPFTYFAQTEDRERRVASSTFSYTIANIERVQTGGGDDKLAGSAGDDRLEGNGGDDELDGRAGNDRLYGGAGDDRLEGGAGDDRLYAGDDDDTDFFFFEPGHGEDRIYEFRNGDDLIVLIGLGITKAQVLENAHAWSDGVGVRIDLRPFGGGTISISDLPRSDLDESDFLL